MAVEISAYMNLRNHYLRDLSEGVRGTLNEKQRILLQSTISELDELHSCSDVYAPGTIINEPGVLLGNCKRVIPRSENRHQSNELYNQISEIIRESWVPSGVYSALQQAYLELNLQPDEETQKAISFSTTIKEKCYSLEKLFCWSIEKEEMQNE